MSAPIIKPIKHKEYSVKQSKYSACGKLPMRAMICGPSQSGKTILLQNRIRDMYNGCVSRIYRFNPSIDIDHTWQPVKTYIADELKPHYK